MTPLLPPNLYERLKLIEPSWYNGWPVYPAKVRTKNGRSLETVAFISGPWPWRHHQWTQVAIDEIDDIIDTESRLPVSIADKLKEIGESSMGTCYARIIFRDGTHQDVSFGTEGPRDFVFLPFGKKGADVVDVKERYQIQNFKSPAWLVDLPTCYFENYKNEKEPNK